MAKTTRSRKIAASAESVWRIVEDPHHLPRWWPGVARVDDVRGNHFTEVIPTRRGKPVRLDFVVLESKPPRTRSWTQELAGTPFERLLSAWTTTITIEPDDERACTVTLEEHQQLRGSFRAGLLLQRRPATRRVDSALKALAELF
ncbi:MAG TPA: SRPBCC domain-containing protein [Solirubrobacteraceae bacterium]|jgi:uncharacterized protein YndB with AHSA1/START domain|nr:SRPBCC domain-containing protein [Solirubrobacteraceae bacterium]